MILSCRWCAVMCQQNTMMHTTAIHLNIYSMGPVCQLGYLAARNIIREGNSTIVWSGTDLDLTASVNITGSLVCLVNRGTSGMFPLGRNDDFRRGSGHA